MVRGNGAGGVAISICSRGICDIVLMRAHANTNAAAGNVFSRRASGGARADSQGRRAVDLKHRGVVFM